LARGRPGVAAKPPPLAICNNWAVIPLPDEILRLNPTWAEFSCCSLGQVAMLYHVVGRNKNSLRSHALVFLSQQPAVMAVPREIEPSEYFVVFAKLSDGEVACERKNRLLVRRQVTSLLIPLYRAGIDTYENVPENNDYFAAGATDRMLPLSFNDGLESTLIADAEVPSQRPGQVTRLGEVRTSSAFLGASPDAAAEGTPTFKVTRSSNCMNNRSREYELAAFPDLHSNGLGTIYKFSSFLY